MTTRPWPSIVGLVLVAGWSVSAAAADGVAVGEEAPNFTLTDVEEQARSLSEFEGRFVVLEWLNHDCPFVRKHYGSGNMQQLQRTYTARGVVWLSINSSAPGKQGHLTAQEGRRLTREKDAVPTAVLLDPSGTVGQRYGAKTTPQLFIINPDGIVIYTGAIDDKPSTRPADLAGATNYVQAALEEALAGRPISTPSTTSYGCSVKYAEERGGASWLKRLFQ